MAEFICRLGTPAGEVVTRTVEATGVQEARARLEREGFRVFNVTPPKTSGVAALTQFGRAGTHLRVKANDFLLFNQQLSALLRAGRGCGLRSAARHGPGQQATDRARRPSRRPSRSGFSRSTGVRLQD